MAIFRKAVLATALIGSGLIGTTGLALADDGHHGHHHGDHHGDHHDGDQAGLLNVDDIQTIVPLNACNNDIPINILGVQVPIQDLGLDVPILSPVDHGANKGAVGKNCANPVAADN